MRNEITRDFNGAEEKGLKVFYNETTGDYEIDTPQGESFSWYDELNEDGDASNGEAIKEVQKFIDEYEY